MNLLDQYFNMIIEEFEEVEKLCSGTEIIEDKLYYLSASYGVLNRVMNFQCEPLLVFMHQILQSTHQSISQRLGMPRKPGTINHMIPDEMIEATFKYFAELIYEFRKKDEANIRKVLQKLANISYAMSGNGFYLYLRGKLNI